MNNQLQISVAKIAVTRPSEPYQRTYDTWNVTFEGPLGESPMLTSEHMIHIAKAIVARNIEETAPWPDRTLKHALCESDNSVVVVIEHAYLD